MGVDTGAFKRYSISKDNEVIFDDDFYDIENEPFEYPNAEFIELADTIRSLSENKIDIRKYLIYDGVDYSVNDYSNVIKQLKEFSFEEAIIYGNKAKEFIEENYEEVKKEYRYIFDPLEVIKYLIDLWVNDYYVSYNY